ncbi:RagB/SusD family nutrient uptake outer membrane protein [Aestuariivivens sediminis]|uniref:RagB/SusD family nutrient uptake outer membrane protein n=1 Tax=Aestuariivivens sediminis TaxID=2913557 RepID=UPI001F5AA701|nr:RagB/SusD family nutrient uptake outer membrane protein [Aestuariivivens sediminis]
MSSKKILKKYTYIFILLTLSIVSCDSFLEEDPQYDGLGSLVKTDPASVENATAIFYQFARRSNAGGGFYDGDRLGANAILLAGTDLGQVRTWYRPYGSGHNPLNGQLAAKWNDGYEFLNKLNLFIDEIDASKEELGELNEVQKKSLAEARLFRGETFFTLLRLYDNILLDTIPSTIETYLAGESIDYTPANKADVYALIDRDFDYAIANLPSASQAEYGKLNSAVARLLKGKSAMWQQDYAEAKTQFEEIINNSGKSLVALDQVFGQNLDHSETLFVYKRDLATAGDGNDYFSLGGRPSHLAGMFQSRWYEDSAGRFVQDLDNGGQSLGWAHPNDYLQSLYGPVSIPDPAQPWFKRVSTEDLRYTTYFFPETLVANNPSHPEFGKEQFTYDDNIRRYHFSLKKYWDTESKEPLTNDSWKDHVAYRLGEVYMLAAEANLWLGDEAKALEYLNAIRRRAYFGSPGSSDTTYDFTTLNLDTYLEESARELAMEGNRWYLLKRLGLLVERQNLHYYYGSNSIDLVLEPMQPHMVNHPIPQSFIDASNNQYPQNDGYGL